MPPQPPGVNPRERRREGTNPPRRCRTRGEANCVKIPILKSRISKTSNNVPFPAESRAVPVMKQFPYPRPFETWRIPPIPRKTET